MPIFDPRLRVREDEGLSGRGPESPSTNLRRVHQRRRSHCGLWTQEPQRRVTEAVSRACWKRHGPWPRARWGLAPGVKYARAGCRGERARRGRTLTDTAFLGVTNSSKAQRRVPASQSFPLPFRKPPGRGTAQPHPQLPDPSLGAHRLQPGEMTSWAETQEIPAPTFPDRKKGHSSGLPLAERQPVTHRHSLLDSVSHPAGRAVGPQGGAEGGGLGTGADLAASR